MAEEIEVRLPFSIKRGDEEIASAAVSRFAWNVSVPKDAVKLKVEKGWITLTGEVDWRFRQEAVADDVRGLCGVVGVSNLITIQPRANASNIRGDIMVALHRSWSTEDNRSGRKRTSHWHSSRVERTRCCWLYRVGRAWDDLSRE